jgi:nucleotide-binding universal stress UspA family protein
MTNTMAPNEAGVHGNVSDNPVRASSSPGGGAGGSGRPIQRIVVAVDGSPASLDALRWAAQLADVTGASIEAVTCWQIPIGLGIEFPLPDTDWAAEAGTVLHSSIRLAIPDTRVPVIGLVLRGPAQQALTAAAEGRHLLVVGSRGHGSVSTSLLGSVSEFVATHSPCPVVIVRHAGEHEGAGQKGSVVGGQPAHP